MNVEQRQRRTLAENRSAEAEVVEQVLSVYNQLYEDTVFQTSIQGIVVTLLIKYLFLQL